MYLKSLVKPIQFRLCIEFVMLEVKFFKSYKGLMYRSPFIKRFVRG